MYNGTVVLGPFLNGKYTRSHLSQHEFGKSRDRILLIHTNFGGVEKFTVAL
jgi:hypothetical protein